MRALIIVVGKYLHITINERKLQNALDKFDGEPIKIRINLSIIATTTTTRAKCRQSCIHDVVVN